MARVTTRWSRINTSHNCKEKTLSWREQVLGMTDVPVVTWATILGFLRIDEEWKGYAPVCLPESKGKGGLGDFLECYTLQFVIHWSQGCFSLVSPQSCWKDSNLFLLNAETQTLQVVGGLYISKDLQNKAGESQRELRGRILAVTVSFSDRDLSSYDISCVSVPCNLWGLQYYKMHFVILLTTLEQLIKSPPG